MKGVGSITKVVVALCGVSSTLGASLWVASLSGPAAVALPKLSGPSYAKDVSGFQPVSNGLVSDLSSTPSKSAAAEPIPVAQPTPGVPKSSGTHQPSSRPGPVPTSSETPSPSLPPPPPPPMPSIAVSMSADVARAHPNQTITYTIRVGNAGPGTATHLVIESHVPDGTTLEGWRCGASTVSANGADHFTCGTLGPGQTPNHPIVYAVPSLAPGESIAVTFWVSVDHNVHNSAIVDHAHAYADNADLADSEQVSVIVK
jgi:uncharacterized repeat protein (TIGR01451 family)